MFALRLPPDRCKKDEGSHSSRPAILTRKLSLFSNSNAKARPFCSSFSVMSDGYKTFPRHSKPALIYFRPNPATKAEGHQRASAFGLIPALHFAHFVNQRPERMPAQRSHVPPRTLQARMPSTEQRRGCRTSTFSAARTASCLALLRLLRGARGRLCAPPVRGSMLSSHRSPGVPSPSFCWAPPLR